MVVTCYIAVMEVDPVGGEQAAAADHLEAAMLLPAERAVGPQRVVGTLDLNIGTQARFEIAF